MTLNMLPSLAQFEQELTSERTRNKIVASDGRLRSDPAILTKLQERLESSVGH
jgi:hypothetical protein